MSKLQVTGPNSLGPTPLAFNLGEYRNVVAQRYTPCAPDVLARYLPPGPYFVSRKIDGELWFIDTTGEAPRLVAANGRIATGECLLLSQAAKLPQGLVIAGELHVLKDGRERVGDVPGALQSASDDMAFAAFDLVENLGSSWADSAYSARLSELEALVPSGQRNLFVAPTRELNSEAEILEFYAETVTRGGAEGAVIRCSDGRILKVKSTVSIDVVVLGYTIDLSAGQDEQVRSLLLGLAAPNGQFVPLGTSGNFVAEFSRSQLLRVLKPLKVESSFRQAASTGQLYQFVRPQIIIEVQVLDLQTFDNQGNPIRQVPLTFTEQGYQAGPKIPAASFLNPVAIRERSDKPDVLTGARWDQISEFLPFSSEAPIELPGAEVVRRQVWVKKSADKTDVRKLVLLKTNKESVDSSYPAYVVHFTDFSLGRKTPLTREVKLAPNLRAAEDIAEQLIEANVKKGWEPA